MDREAFERSRDESRKAAGKLQEIRGANQLEKISELWSEYLTCIQRSYTKLRIACRNGPSKGWCDKVFHTRDDDELLKYVLHARNADEHGIAKITKEKSGGVGLNPKEGNFLGVDELTISGGRLSMGPALAANAKIETFPAEVLLVPVRERGVAYAVPSMHLGNKLADVNLLAVAEAADQFLRAKLDEADKAF
jgi:hypothetical protein